MESIEVAPLKPTISTDRLEEIDIRVGRIEAVEEVEGADRLVKLTVDCGDRKRTILSGMKQERSPEELAALTGTQALFVLNLEPRRMKGELSEGMLFDLGFADGIRPRMAVPETPVPNGTRAG